MAKVDDSIVGYYQEELRYLRNSGAEFSKNYPKVARRLDFNSSESPDPHVERLLESFAFLTARISKAIDDRFPQTAQALLSVLYPHLINPLPSMAIANIQVDPGKVPPGKGAVLSKGTKLLARSLEGVQCGFKTVYETVLRPILVKSVEFSSREDFKFLNSVDGNWCVSITLELKNINFYETDIDELVFHLPEEITKANTLYETLFCENSGEIYLTTDNKIPCVSGVEISQVGFENNEFTLPLQNNSLSHYLLIQEYFHFIEKFLFVRFSNLKQAIQKTKASNILKIVIPLKNPGMLAKIGVTNASFALNCTPVVNLFERPSDPIRIDHKHLQYRLIPDVRRERTTEVYSIQSISGVEEGAKKVINFQPYYSLEGHNPDSQGYWISKRLPASLRGVPGSDVYLSFVDRAFNPIKSKEIIATAKLWCTNRYLASQLPNNASLHPEDKAPVLKITLLNKPKQPVYSPDDGETLWMIISQLSGNYLSILDPIQSVRIIKELLYLFSSRYPDSNLSILEDIKGISVENVTRRFGKEAWKGFVQGFLVKLGVGKIPHQGSNNLILGKILHYYFSSIVHWNSFVETQLIDPQTQTSWMSWQPINGQQIQL